MKSYNQFVGEAYSSRQNINEFLGHLEKRLKLADSS
jgi:hypothetical protein